LTPRHAGLDDDRISFDPAMTGQEGLDQHLRQFFALRGLSPGGPPAVIYWMLHVSGAIPFTPMA